MDCDGEDPHFLFAGGDRGDKDRVSPVLGTSSGTSACASAWRHVRRDPSDALVHPRFAAPPRLTGGVIARRAGARFSNQRAPDRREAMKSFKSVVRKRQGDITYGNPPKEMDRLEKARRPS